MKRSRDRSDFEKRKNFLVPELEPYNCENCGQSVMGGRYNNHCPNCLTSKHVDDLVPGDRASHCNGLMRPTGIIQKNGHFRIKQECVKCKKIGICDASSEDNKDVIIKLSTLPVK
jgi:hypothetical protein